MHLVPFLRLQLFGLTLFLLAAPVLSGKDVESDREPRLNVGEVQTKDATVLARQSPTGKWEILKSKSKVLSGDLLVGLPDATLLNKNKSVKITFHSDLSNTSPYPILESAIRLHSNNQYDLDFTLDRGRVELTNVREKGAAKARLRFYTNEIWELDLHKPGTRVVVEYFGRWPRGSSFSLKPEKGKRTEPILHLVVLVLEGSVSRRCPSCEFLMKAPPGPAFFSWDNVSGRDRTVRRLDKEPKWTVSDPKNPLVKLRKKLLEEFRQSVLKHGLNKTIENYIASGEPLERRLGVIAAGALDKLRIVGDALSTGATADTWTDAVTVTRHWIGRAPGQDRAFYKALLQQRKMKPIHARIMIRLLHGFTDVELARPETYEALIAYLQHEEVPIRGLAAWHLQHAVPGASIPFNPTGTRKELQAVQKQWKKLIPEGKLPPNE